MRGFNVFNSCLPRRSRLYQSQSTERDGGREGRKWGGCVELDLSVANLSLPSPVSAKSYFFSRMDGWMEVMKANGELSFGSTRGTLARGFVGNTSSLGWLFLVKVDIWMRVYH